MLMYEENARKINAALEAMNPAATVATIALLKCTLVNSVIFYFINFI